MLRLKNRQGTELNCTLSVPAFVGIKQRVTFDVNGKTRNIIINPGESIQIKEFIAENQTEVKLSFSKTWSPKSVLKSEDVRELGAMMDEIKLFSDGQAINLKEEIA